MNSSVYSNVSEDNCHPNEASGSFLSGLVDAAASTNTAAPLSLLARESTEAYGDINSSFTPTSRIAAVREDLRIIIPTAATTTPTSSELETRHLTVAGEDGSTGDRVKSANTPQTTAAQPDRPAFTALNESTMLQSNRRSATLALLQGDFRPLRPTGESFSATMHKGSEVASSSSALRRRTSNMRTVASGIFFDPVALTSATTFSAPPALPMESPKIPGVEDLATKSTSIEVSQTGVPAAADCALNNPVSASNISILLETSSPEQQRARRRPQPPEGTQNHRTEEASSLGLHEEDEMDSLMDEDVATLTLTSEGQTIGMDMVLKSVARVRGLRLTWMMYTMIAIVILLFMLLFVQISHFSNKMYKVSGEQVMQARMASSLNNIELLHFALEEMFELVEEFDHDEQKRDTFLPEAPFTGYSSVPIRTDALCSRLFGAPLAVAHYGEDGTCRWKIDCAKKYHPVNFSLEDPSDMIKGTQWFREYDKDTFIAARARTSFANITNHKGKTTMVWLDKEIIGQLLMSNAVAKYSDASLEAVYTGFIVPPIYSDELIVAMHSLDAESRTYQQTRNSTKSSQLMERYNALCSSPDSRYVWNTVLPPLIGLVAAKLEEVASARQPMPPPYLESRGAWGLASRMILCGVMCEQESGMLCNADNPSNVWFIVDHNLYNSENNSMMTMVGAMSIIAVFAFSCLMLITYFGISVPIDVIQFQLMRMIGAERVDSDCVNGKTCRSRLMRWTRRLWLGELTSIINAVHVFGLSFQLNQKYVPNHVLRSHAKELYEQRNRMDVFADLHLGSDSREDDEDSLSDFGDADGFPTGEDPVLLFDHLSTMQRHSDSEAGDGGTLNPSAVRRETLIGWMRPTQAHSISLTNFNNNNGSVTPNMSIVRGGSNSEQDRSTTLRDQQNTNMFGANSLSVVVSVDHDTAATTAAAENEASIFIGNENSAKPSMLVRRDYDATILCICFNGIDNAYLQNYSLAFRQHRRIMRFLLGRIRHYKGAVYYRSGEVLGAAWNAFDSCSNHAERAAMCAQDVARAFSPYRAEGLQLGIVLHQGPFICGTVQDTREAFATAFGEAPKQAHALAELAATQPYFTVLATEPVKQALASLYECNIVDVIWLADFVHPLILFELGGFRSKQPDSVRSAVYSEFAVEYAKVFSHFRNHEFEKALDGIAAMRSHLDHSRGEKLLLRLERLSRFYSHNTDKLPRPYARPFPRWADYEATAQAGLVESESGVCGVCVTPHLAACDTSVKGAASPSLSSGRYMLPDVFYRQTPVMQDDYTTFKKELEANVRRRGTPARQPMDSSGGGPLQSSAAIATEHQHTTHQAVEDSSLSTLLGPHHSQQQPHPNRSGVASVSVIKALPPPSSTTSHGPRGPLTVASLGTGTGSASTSAALLSGPASPPIPHLSVSSGASQGRRSGEGINASISLSISSNPGSPSLQDMELPSTAVNETSHSTTPTTPTTTVSRSPAVGGYAMHDSDVGLTAEEEAHHLPCLLACEEEEEKLNKEGAPSGIVEGSESNNNKDGSGEVASSGVMTDRGGDDCVSPTDAAHMPYLCFSFANYPGALVPIVPPQTALECCRGCHQTHSLPQLAGVPTVADPTSPLSPMQPNGFSAIQSFAMTLPDPNNAQYNNNMRSIVNLDGELPMEIKAQNGSTYLRSARMLGKGSFGVVYLGMDVLSGRLVAIKFMPLATDDAGVSAIEAEVLIMQQVKDIHVVEFISYAFVNDTIIIIMECMMAGSLQNMISAFTSLPNVTARLFIRDVLRGLQTLHSMGAIHRDVKPQNVLLTLTGSCKISDFGASAWLHELARKESQGLVLGTPVYLAPEAAQGKPVPESDVWSCGIMFLQLITGKLPYTSEQLQLQAPILVYQIGCGSAVPVVPEGLDELDAALVAACLQKDPKDRKPALELLQMPLFAL